MDQVQSTSVSSCRSDLLWLSSSLIGAIDALNVDAHGYEQFSAAKDYCSSGDCAICSAVCPLNRTVLTGAVVEAIQHV